LLVYLPLCYLLLRIRLAAALLDIGLSSLHSLLLLCSRTRCPRAFVCHTSVCLSSACCHCLSMYIRIVIILSYLIQQAGGVTVVGGAWRALRVA